MIRINLLPEKKKKKKPKPVPGFIVAGAILSTVALIVVIFVTYNVKAELKSLRERSARNKERITALQKRLKELKNYEALLQSVQKKKEIIVSLRKNQEIPVRLLDDLSRYLPDSVWFKSLQMKGKIVNLDGFAFTNSDIVNFVNNLKRSDLFKSVSLLETRRQEITEKELKEKITVYYFRMVLEVKG